MRARRARREPTDARLTMQCVRVRRRAQRCCQRVPFCGCGACHPRACRCIQTQRATSRQVSTSTPALQRRACCSCIFKARTPVGGRRTAPSPPARTRKRAAHAASAPARRPELRPRCALRPSTAMRQHCALQRCALQRCAPRGCAGVQRRGKAVVRRAGVWLHVQTMREGASDNFVVARHRRMPATCSSTARHECNPPTRIYARRWCNTVCSVFEKDVALQAHTSVYAGTSTAAGGSVPPDAGVTLRRGTATATAEGALHHVPRRKSRHAR